MRIPDKLDLKEHIASKEKKQRYVTRLFQKIAPRYDFFNIALSMGRDRRWKRRLVDMAKLNGDELVLDIACGTADITFEIARRLESGFVVGLDITPAMLEIAERRRRGRLAKNVSFHQSDIMRMPFKDETFDCLTGGYALRNVPDIEAAIEEIRRVLKPGGRFLSLDFGRPRSPIYHWLYINFLIVVGSVAGLILHGDADTYRYIPETVKLYPGQRGVLELMKRAGFVDAGFREFGGGIIAINWGRKPRLAALPKSQ
jgi:demethylmenaquinone methyltransferase/2-methoxy-6-polyprenyl-1,4-benzoquinol methylase